MEIVERFEKIFILCPMPFTSMILFGRDDIHDCMLSVSIMVCIGAILGVMRFVSIDKILKKEGKVKKIE